MKTKLGDSKINRSQNPLIAFSKITDNNFPFFFFKFALFPRPAYGITGILNFAPIVLQVPEDVMVNNVNLAIELENLSYFIQD